MELRLWPRPSAASGSPQVACWTHSLCVWPWALGVRSPQNGEQSGPESAQPPPAGLASPGLCLGKNQHSVAGSQGGAGCFIHGGPGGGHTGKAGGPGWTWSPGGVGWVRACWSRNVWLIYPET